MSFIFKCHALMVQSSVHGSAGIQGFVLADLFETQAIECFWVGVRAASIVMACVGIPIVIFAGMIKVSERA